MARGLTDLANDMVRLSAKVEGIATQGVKEVAGAMLGYLAINTPVDTSQAISNWRIGVGAMQSGEILPHVPGTHGSTYSVSSSETVRIGLTALQQRRPGQTVYLYNNLKYIRALDEGSSAQSPAGLTNRAQIIGRRAFENYVRKLK